MNLEICPKVVFKKLFCLIVILLFLNILGLISKFYFGHDHVYGLVSLFDFDTEQNIPTFYSATAILCSSLLLFFITFTHKSNGCRYLGWMGLAVIFLFLSIDEISSIHERLTKLVRAFLDTSGLLFSAWVIPYGLVVIIFVAAYLRFLIRLPKNIMFLFVLSGMIFVLGAIGLELLEGNHYELYGSADVTFAVFYTIEEFMEMLGIALFIYTLLSYIESEFGLITITINKSSLEKLNN